MRRARAPRFVRTSVLAATAALLPAVFTACGSPTEPTSRTPNAEFRAGKAAAQSDSTATSLPSRPTDNVGAANTAGAVMPWF